MLTEEAFSERMWGGFPALRKVLEDQRVADRFYGPTSVSDNLFNKMDRLLKLEILVSENASDILEAFKESKVGDQGRGGDPEWRKILDDLAHLSEDLRAASNDLGHKSARIAALIR